MDPFTTGKLAGKYIRYQLIRANLPDKQWLGNVQKLWHHDVSRGPQDKDRPKGSA